MLVIWSTAQISMALSVIFFTKPDPHCYDLCPDETYSGGDESCAEQCDAECAGNGLLTSVLTALFSTPLVGFLNYWFYWLRRPFAVDVSLKAGEIEAVLIQSRKSEKGNCCQRRLTRLVRDQRECCHATCGASHHRHHAPTTTLTSRAEGNGPEQLANRREVAKPEHVASASGA